MFHVLFHSKIVFCEDCTNVVAAKDNHGDIIGGEFKLKYYMMKDNEQYVRLETSTERRG